MNYRHAYHAGNFADVLKHTALMAILAHLRKKETAFAVIDTHAGRGLYDLSGEKAAKTDEAASGIGRLRDASGLPPLLESYVSFVRGFGNTLYPGSPLIAAKLLRRQDRLIAIERHPEDFRALAAAVKEFPNSHAISGEGYRELQRLVPTRERRGLVLIDPPYETENEWQTACAALIAAHRRLANGIYCLWYPRKSLGPVEAASGELLNAGIDKFLRVELNIGANADAASDTLTATGLFVVNAPFGFAEAIEPVLEALRERLSRGPNASARLIRPGAA